METRNILSSIFLSLVLVIAATFATSFTVEKAFAAGSCSPENTVMNIVAHQDDSLLFQSPDLFHDIQNDRCTMTIFVTAGDAGSGEQYWLGREDGVKAAYANMSGVANEWTVSDAGISGHPIPVFTLASHPNISMAFLRLPDGGVDGNGLSNPVSLKKLWEGSITSLTAIDNSSSYSKQDLINTFAALYAQYQPSRINTQNFVISFGDLDHSDHIATGYFSKSAHQLYTTPHTIYAYQGYDSVFHAINVFNTDLAAKIGAFFTYTPFDPHACQSYEACTGSYDDWLERQYIAGSESGGQADVCPNLGGTQTSVPNGYHKTADGQCVPDTSSGQVCQSFVSDATNTVNTGGNAVATFVPSTWTVNIPGATWIWNAFHVADPAEGETVTFTKTINVSGAPTSASIIIGADDNYEASLNGTQFGADSAFNNFTAGNEDTYDITSLLRTGDNTLSITVHNLATGDTNPEDNPAGLLYKLDVKGADCNPATTTPPSTDNGNGTSNGNGGSTGGSGGGYTPPQLKISNQSTTVVRSSGKVLITWITSRPAYGHVIYGIDTGAPYTLDLTKPNFGYPASFPTDPSVQGHLDPYGKVRIHAITLSGLVPGKKYRYRIVSHASPAVTTEEGYFIAPMSEDAPKELAISEEVGGDNPILAHGQDDASVTADEQAVTASQGQQGSLSSSTTDDSSAQATDATSTATTSEVASGVSDTENQNAATALALGGLKSWQIGFIIVILLSLIGWLAFGRKKNTLQ